MSLWQREDCDHSTRFDQISVLQFRRSMAATPWANRARRCCSVSSKFKCLVRSTKSILIPAHRAKNNILGSLQINRRPSRTRCGNWKLGNLIEVLIFWPSFKFVQSSLVSFSSDCKRLTEYIIQHFQPKIATHSDRDELLQRISFQIDSMICYPGVHWISESRSRLTWCVQGTS